MSAKVLVLVAASMMCLSVAGAQMIAGGFGSTQTGSEIDSDFQRNLQTVIRPQVASRLGRNLEQFDLLSVRSQVVAGTNYRAVVRISPTEVVLLQIYEPLPYTQEPMQLKDVRMLRSRY